MSRGCRDLGTLVKRNKNQLNLRLHDNRDSPVSWDSSIVIPGSQLGITGLRVAGPGWVSISKPLSPLIKFTQLSILYCFHTTTGGHFVCACVNMFDRYVFCAHSQRFDGFGFMNEVRLTCFPKTIAFISKSFNRDKYHMGNKVAIAEKVF